jgi:hypothetical protein
MYTNINEIVRQMFFPLHMLKIKTGIAAGVAILVLLGMGLASIPNNVWYPVIQIIVFTLGLIALAPSTAGYGGLFEWMSENNPMGPFVVAIGIVAFINIIKSIVEGPGDNESFFGGSAAIGRTPFKNPNPFCPPTLDFRDPIDSDTERQTPGCIANPNALTEEQQLDEIDIYLRDSQETIARMNGYLNVAKPDERWLSKKEMDDPNNRDIARNFKL